MDRFIRNCLFLMLIVLTLCIIKIRFINHSQRDNYTGASVGTSYAEDVDMDVLLDRCEVESVRRCEDIVMKNLPEVIKIFRKHLEIRTEHHTYLATGKRFLLEVGGKYGKIAEGFQTLYKPRHIILEPNKYSYKVLKNKFKTNDRVTMMNVGLAAERGQISLRYTRKGPLQKDPYRLQKGWNNITLIDSTEFFKNLGVGFLGVDLLAFDCQGCEFEVMEKMFLTNMTNLFKNIQFKWHNNKEFVKDKPHRYCRIATMLSRTHRPTFMFQFVEESWRWKGLP